MYMPRYHKHVNSRLSAVSVVKPIEVFKPLANMAATNSGNVKNQQQIYQQQQQLYQQKQQQMAMEQGRKNLILKPEKKNKNLPGTKLLIKLAEQRQKENWLASKKKQKYNNKMINDITDDIMHDLV